MRNNEVRVATLPKCDICPTVGMLPAQDAEYDGKTLAGPWANMCSIHFALYGTGLGTGRGQHLVVLVRDEEETKAADTFEAWKRKVNRAVAAKVGLSADDLEDFDAWGCYESGMSPEEAAEECLANSDTYQMFGGE